MYHRMTVIRSEKCIIMQFHRCVIRKHSHKPTRYSIFIYVYFFMWKNKYHPSTITEYQPFFLLDLQLHSLVPCQVSMHAPLSYGTTALCIWSIVDENCYFVVDENCTDCTQEDMCRLHANTTPHYMRDLSIQISVFTKLLEPFPDDTKG